AAAVRASGRDELVISTHPPGRSHWLERGGVDKARERFELPVTHVVVDLDAQVIEEIDALPLADELREIHRAALGVGALSDEWAADRLPRHMARDGFVFLAAREADEVVGFGYGYTASCGQWWPENVARSLSPEQRAKWLDPPHFEIVELH